jgi:VCBS repeat-containing protein
MPVDGTPQPAGNELPVNTTTLNTQTKPAIALLADGGFVVAWQSDSGDDTGRLGIFVQRYDASGNKVGAETLVFRLINQTNPSVAALTNGGFVVTFDASPPPAPTYLGYDIRSALFNADGTRVNGVVTDFNGLGDFASSVAGLPDGGFVVAWQSEQADGTYDILVQRHDASGIWVGSAVQANSTFANGQFEPHVAVLAGGGFVVAWQSEAQDGSGLGIFGRRFDANGIAVGGEFQINSYTSNDQVNASIAGLSTGGFVVVWESTEQDGSSGGIYGQIYDASGNRVGDEFPINRYTPNWQGNPTVTAFADGSFVVIWQSAGQDGSGDGIYGQLFSSTGQRVGEEFLINGTTAGSQVDPVVTVLGPNDFEVAWTSGGDIFARHFTLSASNKENNAPVITQIDATGAINELPNETGRSDLRTQSGTISFTDADANDRPTASVTNIDFLYQNAEGQTFQLTDDQLLTFRNAFSISGVGNTNNGTVNWTFQIADSAIDFLGVGETVTLTATVRIDDHNGGTVERDITMTIQGQNDLPSPVHDIAIVPTGSPVHVDANRGLLANDLDPDIHDTLVVTPTVTQSNYGTLTLNSDGSYDYVANSRPIGNSPAHDVFTYVVNDGHTAVTSPDAFLNVSVTRAESPYSSIVLLEIHHGDAVQYGSGVVVGQNDILTAAHLFQPNEFGPVTEIHVLTADGNLFHTENLSINLGTNAWPSDGPGLLARVDGDDAQPLANGRVPNDLAIVGIPIDIGSMLQPLGIAANGGLAGRLGQFTLFGFPQNEGLVSDRGWAFNFLTDSWRSFSFNASDGMSGGPLLNANNQIVGIQSSISDPFGNGSTMMEADRIDATELTLIHQWMQNDYLLAV